MLKALKLAMRLRLEEFEEQMRVSEQIKEHESEMKRIQVEESIKSEIANLDMPVYNNTYVLPHNIP